MKSKCWLAILAFSFLALFFACESGDGGSPPPSTKGWTWMSGGNTVNQTGTYGLKGVAAPSNVPGARTMALFWLDSSGKLWLFGGFGYDSAGIDDRLNDLWVFSPTTREWTWVSGSNSVNQAGTYGTKGVADPLNVPGARMGAVSWLDPDGNLWIFGGLGNISEQNDLWKYDSISREWTWISGSSFTSQPGTYGIKGIASVSNIPGVRYASISWVDSHGNLWLFGGFGYDSTGAYGDLNDLWKFDPATLEWTWVSGSNMQGQGGIYGTKGTAAPSNVPGGREAPVSWIDSSDSLWLFGGLGSNPNTPGGLNDLWKFDLTTLEWTWVSGSSTVDQGGAYGAKGIANALNIPGARDRAVSWLDSSGKLWLFGGEGRDSANAFGALNDLWKYDSTTNEWTWVSGSSMVDQAGTYGTKGTADSLNVPGARTGAVAQIDSSGLLWLFGGNGRGSTGNRGRLNDLWRYIR
jgi:N-acetylneuraminic acid mutarotase